MSDKDRDPRVFSEVFRAHSYEVDFRKQATLEAVCRWFLDAAWSHAEALGVGFGHLAAQQKFWVLTRLLLEVRRYPRWGETVRLETWPCEAKGIFALRDFELLDPHGSVLAGGSSAWCVLDVLSKRPQRIEKLLGSVPAYPERRATSRDPVKIAGAHDGAVALETQVRYSDIDVNRHATSARYIGWLFDSHPLEFHQRHQLERLEVNFVSEAKAGDIVQLRTGSPNSPARDYSLVKPGAGEVCRLASSWVESAA